MPKYLIDANLPRKISVWQTDEFEFVTDIKADLSDGEIWEYAKAKNLIIVTKDADFSHRIMFSNPPPIIVHIKIGNIKLKEFESFINKVWLEIETFPSRYKLINVFFDRIEAIN